MDRMEKQRPGALAPLGPCNRESVVGVQHRDVCAAERLRWETSQQADRFSTEIQYVAGRKGPTQEKIPARTWRPRRGARRAADGDDVMGDDPGQVRPPVQREGRLIDGRTEPTAGDFCRSANRIPVLLADRVSVQPRGAGSEPEARGSTRKRDGFSRQRVAIIGPNQ